MKKLIETIKNIFKIEELRKRILFTLALILVYRFGSFVVIPGINPEALQALQSQVEGNGLMGLLNIFSGGAFRSATHQFCIGNHALHLCIHRYTADGNCGSPISRSCRKRERVDVAKLTSGPAI